MVPFIRIFAALAGIVTLTAAILASLRQSRQAKGRTIGKGAKTRTTPVLLLMALGFVGLGYVSWRPLPLPLPSAWGLLFAVGGAALYFPGLALYLWGLKTLGAQFGVSSALGADLHQEHRLVTTGPFAFVRHPMYVGVFLAAVGGLLIFRTWAMALFAVMSLAVMARAGQEEALLAQEFGHAWRQYCADVPKWFPRRRPGDND